MRLPSARGPLSSGVVQALSDPGGRDVAPLVQHVQELPAGTDLLADDDLHLALWMLYELHYGGFDGVDPDHEWDPDLLRLRAAMESVVEGELRARGEPHVRATVDAGGPLAERLFDLAARWEGPSVARYVHRDATRTQFAELLVHRSIYQLKESDPQSWVIPRITGKPKAALVELQYDEYGGGRPERLHATMFGDAMEGTGLDRSYGAYLDRVPGYTLANNNVMSLFGLHRRLRGASMGHLGAYEATSSIPCRKYAGGARRLGLPEQVAAYFDEHVEADAVHEQLAFRDICAGLVESGQAEEADVVLGAVACLLMDNVVGEPMLAAWEAGRSALYDAAAVAVGGAPVAPGAAPADRGAAAAAPSSIEKVAS